LSLTAVLKVILVALLAPVRQTLPKGTTPSLAKILRPSCSAGNRPPRCR
jgi:hypothetical protein